jgi:fructosamine-3-kinase
MKSTPFLIHITEELQKHLGKEVQIIGAHPEYGGSINESYRIETNEGDFFLKRNEKDKFKEMYEAEKQGLITLKTHSTFVVPQPLLNGSFKQYNYLVLEYIQKGNRENTNFRTSFGIKLAELHKNQNEFFGLDYNNYIGSLEQINTPSKDWADFFVGNRIVPLVSVAHEKGKFDLATVKQFEKLCFKLQDYFPKENPALLHGDLWSGNYLSTTDEQPCIFDPAIYYGHREMDLAMMNLFGGFHHDTFKAYEEAYPLEIGWRERIDLCNLYPLLVHVNLFGGNYIKQVKLILNHFA